MVGPDDLDARLACVCAELTGNADLSHGGQFTVQADQRHAVAHPRQDTLLLEEIF